MKTNTEEAIALTLDKAFEMRAASYVKDSECDIDTPYGDYTRSMEDCLIEAGKKNGLTDNMWALLNLAVHWCNDCAEWSKDVLAGKNILEECEKDAEDHKQEVQELHG